MIPAISTTTIGGDLAAKIEAIGASPFQAAGLFSPDLTDSGMDVATVRRRWADAGVTLTDYFPLRDFEGMPDDRRQAACDTARTMLDAAVELGCRILMGCATVAPHGLGDRSRIVDDLRWLADEAQARGLSFAYEALPWAAHVRDYRDAWEIVKAVDHPAFGLVLDTFHIYAPGYDDSAIADIPGDRIGLVQVSDAPMLDLDFLTWSRNHRGLPGDGAFPLARFVDLLRRTGYRGLVSLECFHGDLKSAEPRQVCLTAHERLTKLLAHGA